MAKAVAKKLPAKAAVREAAAPAKSVSKDRGAPLVEMRDVSIAFGGIKAVDGAGDGDGLALAA